MADNRLSVIACPASLLALLLWAGVTPHRQAATAPPSFEELARRADAAREAGRLDEAVQLYRQGLALRPRWTEGLWATGTITYELDRFAECADAFARLVSAEPLMGPAWALRGLCEFGRAAYGPAGEHLEKALSLGLPPREELTRVARYHQALLLVREAKFDLAIAPLSALLQVQAPTTDLELACGLVLLRRPTLPWAIPAPELDLVRRAGEAYCAHLARHPEIAGPRFEALIASHPRERYLHYGYGLTLAQQGSAAAIAEFRREMELFPDDVLARVELAFALLTRGESAEALAPAEEAARLAPGLFAAHLVLGRALVDEGALERGILELEQAATLAPHIPAISLALARAYARAGRPAEAEEANERFQQLEAARRGTSRSGSPRPEAP